ncbi:MAG: hypothetical protein EXS51_02855 [Candidatus Taylorbacteria bacterium]|nr:hypothetical protein [Candidatus Taylorbacteria bacterium]
MGATKSANSNGGKEDKDVNETNRGLRGVSMTFSGKKASVPPEMRSPSFHYLEPSQFAAAISPALMMNGK